MKENLSREIDTCDRGGRNETGNKRCELQEERTEGKEGREREGKERREERGKV